MHFARGKNSSTNGAKYTSPRATPWVLDKNGSKPCNGATGLCRPYRAFIFFKPKPRALPWAGISAGLWPSACPFWIARRSNLRGGLGKIGGDECAGRADMCARMKKLLIPVALLALCITAAADPAPASSKFSTEYEGHTYSFPDEASLAKWKAEREASIYGQIGGKAAIDAAVERFYVKVLADDRIRNFFDDVDMVRQRTKQKAFLSAALGGPIPWDGKDMRRAHAKLPGLNDSHFNAVAENLKATLEELKVKPELIAKILAIAESTRNDVLNRPSEAARADGKTQ